MAPGRIGDYNPRGQSIGLALGRLRNAVMICCWIIGLALCVQLVTWSLATYTDMRFETPEDSTTAVAEAEPQVVVAESPRQQRIRQAREADMGIDLSSEPEAASSEPQQQTGRVDAMFATLHNLAAGIGRCAMLAVVPLMMVGVMLAAGSATPGVDRVVSSLVWALIAAALILPLGNAFSLPWDGGALSTYEQVTAPIDHMQIASTSDEQTASAGQATTDAAPSTLTMHLRFGLLPLACIVGITLVGLRFCSGVEAGVLAGESMRLDPVLEREAANISPSSLHSGRTTGALTRTMQEREPEQQTSATAKSVSAGQSPQRLI